MKFKALIGTSILAMAVATPAWAQGAADDDTADDNIIIVTATLRAANVQDIPIAVTAVSPADLERQGVQDIRTLSSISPSFNLQSSQTETQGDIDPYPRRRDHRQQYRPRKFGRRIHRRCVSVASGHCARRPPRP